MTTFFQPFQSIPNLHGKRTKKGENDKNRNLNRWRSGVCGSRGAHTLKPQSGVWRVVFCVRATRPLKFLNLSVQEHAYATASDIDEGIVLMPRLILR